MAVCSHGLGEEVFGVGQAGGLVGFGDCGAALAEGFEGLQLAGELWGLDLQVQLFLLELGVVQSRVVVVFFVELLAGVQVRGQVDQALLGLQRELCRFCQWVRGERLVL